MRMTQLNSKATPILLYLVMLLFSQIYLVHGQEEYSPAALTLTVFGDGAVHVTYSVAVNESTPRISISLFGRNLENVIVVDENNMLLDYSLNGSTMIVDALGAVEVEIEYEIVDLTNKTGRIWSLAIQAPCNFKVIFPTDTTVLDMSEMPMEIWSEEQRPILLMPAGAQRISYVIGAIVARTQVRDAIDNAEQTISSLQTEGLAVPEAEAMLAEAEQALERKAQEL